jgi:hypothetical protein
MAVSCDTVEWPSPDTVEDSDSRLTEELPFTSAKNAKKQVLIHQSKEIGMLIIS